MEGSSDSPGAAFLMFALQPEVSGGLLAKVQRLTSSRDRLPRADDWLSRMPENPRLSTALNDPQRNVLDRRYKPAGQPALAKPRTELLTDAGPLGR